MSIRMSLTLAFLVFWSSANACRPVPFITESGVPKAKAVGMGIVTGTTHSSLEEKVLSGESYQFPGFILEPYEIRVAISERWRGWLPDVLVAVTAGCPPPYQVGDRVLVLLRDDGEIRVEQGQVGDTHREALSREES